MKRAVLAILGLQYLAALLVEALSGFHHTPAFATYFAAALGIMVFVIGGRCIFNLGLLMWRKADQPGREILSVVRSSSDVAFVYFAVAAQLTVLSWLKVAMPLSVGFRADEFLANVDAAIFRTDPWKLVQWVPSLDRPYLTWVSTTLLVMILLPLLAKEPRREAAIVSYFVIVAIASLGQFLLPSAGPVFYDRIGLGERFADLPVRPWVKVASDYLWANYASGGASVGTGISAFPSLHVAGAAWVALVVSSYFPKLAVLAWGYCLMILIGSVQLGWHYAIDGIVGVLAAIIAFKASQDRLLPVKMRQLSVATASHSIRGVNEAEHPTIP